MLEYCALCGGVCVARAALGPPWAIAAAERPPPARPAPAPPDVARDMVWVLDRRLEWVKGGG